MAEYEISNIPGSIDFECNSDAVKRTVQNAKNLLMTEKGEVPYDRLRGFDPALYHQPLPALRGALIPELNRVMMWEPDVSVAAASAQRLPDGETLITVILDVHISE